MTGCIQLALEGGVATVTISHPARFNAMSRLMWRELRAVFEQLQVRSDIRCIVVRGEGAHFCAGGDISEYTSFRFEEAYLRDFHENDVWGALNALLNCDVPMVAHIEGNCMGAGVEIASCCDIRLASTGARFGAPIAKLGFPMAPREAALVAREVGLVTARQMLLEAAIFSAPEMQTRGFISWVLAPAALGDEVRATAQRIASLAPQAARANKQVIRALSNPLAEAGDPQTPCMLALNPLNSPYAYASSYEHREGIEAFISKRTPRFF
jgi:enoyl-CoA hydratase/carnithine racemase